MQIIGYRYYKLNLFLLLAIGLLLIICGTNLIFQSSFNLNDFDRLSGPVSKIEIVGEKDLISDNRLLIQIKNYSEKICFSNVRLKDKLCIGDSITVYLNHKSNFNIEHENTDVYGLYLKNECLIDLVETSRVNRWIGLLLMLLGLVLISGELVYYRYAKKEKYKIIDIDAKNLPY